MTSARAASCACAEETHIEREYDCIAQALQLIGTVSGYAEVAHQLRQTRIVFQPTLPDRAQTSLRHVITLGPEPFAGSGDHVLVSLAGTLVHEHWHTQQNPFLKTASYWHGVAARTHPMRRYEWPAYERQIVFLDALGQARPQWVLLAAQEKASVLEAFRKSYG